MTLSEVRAHALSLPGVTEEAHFDRTSFRVRGKIFATARPQDPHIHVFVDELDRDLAVSRYPDHIEKLWWGRKVVGVRIRLEKVPVTVVKKLLMGAWKRKAGPALAGPRAAKRG